MKEIAEVDLPGVVAEVEAQLVSAEVRRDDLRRLLVALHERDVDVAGLVARVNAVAAESPALPETGVDEPASPVMVFGFELAGLPSWVSLSDAQEAFVDSEVPDAVIEANPVDGLVVAFELVEGEEGSGVPDVIVTPDPYVDVAPGVEVGPSVTVPGVSGSTSERVMSGSTTVPLVVNLVDVEEFALAVRVERDRLQAEMDRVAIEMMQVSAEIAAFSDFLEDPSAVDFSRSLRVGEAFTIRDAFFPIAGEHGAVYDSWHFARDGGARKHEGIDIFADRGTPLVAIEDGVVSRVSTNTRLGGKTVSVVGAVSGVRWYYAHLDAIVPGLSAGDRVSAGQVIGTVGNTGNAAGTAPHLHLGMYVKGVPVNPFPVMDALVSGSNSAVSKKVVAGDVETLFAVDPAAVELDAELAVLVDEVAVSLSFDLPSVSTDAVEAD